MKLSKLYGVCALSALVAFSAVSCIDEDLSNCPPPDRELHITYRIRLSEDQDESFNQKLTSVHMGFWTADDSLVREVVIPSEELPEDMTFAVTLPVDNYSHLVTANCQRPPSGDHVPFADAITEVAIEQFETGDDTIGAMKIPPYAGLLRINLEDSAQTEYVVDLRPVVGKMEITLNHSANLSNIRCHVGGTKAGCICWISDWIDNPELITDATAYAAPTDEELTDLYSFYTFPTAAGEGGAAGAPATKAGADGQWMLYFYADYADRTMQWAFTIDEPLYAGHVYRNEFTISEFDDNETGVEVNPDWKPGTDIDVDM
ncbi:MAG: FimB/Mfa2 family fimbrial subunit [bacterium]|uniref:FimB/Mfa2 family fimbrial subunit n=1 Tax=Candidatus Aphodosoma intestinipullorum TaxID=2840674 RepID=A0A940DJD0_9BACT|nr:FimB/Mfa2 family fimbrial subunit [Candidatus Aphodosoma intestinipullorum]